MFLVKYTGMLIALQTLGLFMQHTGRRLALVCVVGSVLDVEMATFIPFVQSISIDK
jgi:hypothetical protein